jgi:hypothetical protein
MGITRVGITGKAIRRGRGRILATGVLGAALIVTLGAAAPAAGSRSRAGAVTDDNFGLNAVSALSALDAWAVGDGATVLHWNGTSWAPVKIPGLPVNVYLHAVDAVSPSDVWAAGEAFATGSPVKTLIVHWNGSAWKQVASPNPPKTSPDFFSLSMDSATDGWALGQASTRTGTVTSLVAHWNGTSWQQVTTSPSFFFAGVASLSPTNATAVGSEQTGSHTFTPAAFHWNGTSWAQTATLPPPRGVPASQLVGADGLSAPSAADMWTLGARQTSAGARNLAWHWNGTRWTVMAVPSPGITTTGESGLVSVAAISPANVWAVGFTATSNAQATVSVHWNGTSWSQVATPNPGGSNESAVLNGLAAAGPGNIWAVGYYYTGFQIPNTLILRWNGTRWIRS